MYSSLVKTKDTILIFQENHEPIDIYPWSILQLMVNVL